MSRDLSATDLAGLELEAAREQARRHWLGVARRIEPPRQHFPAPKVERAPRLVFVITWAAAIAAPVCVVVGWLGGR